MPIFAPSNKTNMTIEQVKEREFDVRIVPGRLPFTFLLVVLSFMHTSAKDIDHRVQGVVFDSFTEQGIPALITLMTADSLVVDTMTAIPDDYPFRDYPHASDYEFTIQKTGHYIVKAEMEGYESAYVNFELRSNREQDVKVKPLRMEKDFHDLPEVVVKATKVKMVMKGDTIVYNADAFNLAEGSMLDALIARLPGTRLNKEGEIFVNGKKIESLLVNGRDFFSGSPKVALQNLPAYTVNKIKVYDEAGIASRIMQRDMGDKRYVMDVNLKKEYSKSYFGNAEAGYGTDYRYSVKAFGMKMSEKEWMMGTVNVNNLSDNQKTQLIYRDGGGYDLSWSPVGEANGLLTNREANIGYVRYFDNNRNWLESRLLLVHNNTNEQSRENAQTYLPNGDSFRQQQSSSTLKTTKLEGSINHHLEKGAVFNMSEMRLKYDQNKGFGYSEQTISNSASVLNEMLTRNSHKSKNIVANGSVSGGTKVIADMLRWSLSADYDRLTADQFSLNDIQYTTSEIPRDFRNNYRDDSHQTWNVKENTMYEICWPELKITPQYEYNYRYNKTSNMLYRLDRLADADSTQFDLLPSAREVLADALDAPNSYDFHEYQNHHRFRLQVTSDKELSNRESKGIVRYWSLQLPVRLVHKNLYYNRLGRHDVKRHAVFFEPDFQARGKISSIEWNFKGSIWSEIPDMAAMVDYRDDSDPLNIRLGNPELKNRHYYHTSFNLSRRISRHQQLFSVNLSYNQQDNAVAYATEFDKNTGAFTIFPVSVNGNWSASADMGYARSLDKPEKLTLDNQFSYNYHHSVDMATVAGMTNSQRSIVNNHQFSDNLKLTFRPNDMHEFTLHGGCTYYLVGSERAGFEDIHAVDYLVGFNATISLPAKFQLVTDLTMYARRGYQQSEMNTTNWVWNAQITRSFLKGSLIAKLRGFDILQQISTTRYAMNEQGRTESWHNSVPRYVMLSLSWKFNANSKKKHE